HGHYLTHRRYALRASRPGPPRKLHSFPTRRSSDLRRAPRAEELRVGVFEREAEDDGEDEQLRLAEHDDRREQGGLDDDQDGGFRSEEHTSELQSRENLVCRLLLEKKKMRQSKENSG